MSCNFCPSSELWDIPSMIPLFPQFLFVSPSLVLLPFPPFLSPLVFVPCISFTILWPWFLCSFLLWPFWGCISDDLSFSGFLLRWILNTRIILLEIILDKIVNEVLDIHKHRITPQAISKRPETSSFINLKLN